MVRLVQNYAPNRNERIHRVIRPRSKAHFLPL